MIVQTATYNHKELIIRTAGKYLPVTGIIAACVICASLGLSIKIERVYILLSGSLFSIIPFKKSAMVRLQMVMLFYLVCIPVNQISFHYFSIPYVSLHMPYNIIILLLCAFGYLLSGLYSSSLNENIYGDSIAYAWLLALAIIMFHIILLTPIMKIYYGYGYENNIKTMGQVCLYYILFLLLWNRLGESGIRRISGMIISLYYLVILL